ncbi:thioredoxin [Roseateles sp.]|uniref:thioredoxin n=1 Tax=Roseateles sp. TaxID=1971397 RepID=UPI0039ED17EE
MPPLITTLTDASFDSEVLARPGLTLVDFWAPWCGPCKSLAPLLDEVAGDYEGEAAIAKINADDNPQSVERFSVRGLPTLILFHDGVECERVLGLISKSRLATLLDKHLQGA